MVDVIWTLYDLFEVFVPQNNIKALFQSAQW